METEIEAKFPDIDTGVIRSRLAKIGATQIHPEVLMRRKNFDYPDKRLDKVNGWIRLRDEGQRITLCYKQLNDRTVHGTQEVEIMVDSFDRAAEFLIAIGLEIKTYQETKRERWMYKEVEIAIDTWPWIPSFVELEGASENILKEVSNDLDLDWSSALHGSVEPVYQMHYDFTESEINSWETIIFTPEPDWLLAKKK